MYYILIQRHTEGYLSIYETSKLTPTGTHYFAIACQYQQHHPSFVHALFERNLTVTLLILRIPKRNAFKKEI